MKSRLLSVSKDLKKKKHPTSVRYILIMKYPAKWLTYKIDLVKKSIKVGRETADTVCQ